MKVRAKQAFAYNTESLSRLGRTVNKNIIILVQTCRVNIIHARSPFAREEPEPKSSILQ